MADYKDALKSMRQSDYGADEKKEMDDGDEEGPSTPRTIMLTDDEAKSLQPYSVHPGEEIILEVSGKLEDDGHFHVMSVKYAQEHSPEDTAEVAGMEAVPPTMRMQTQPSPS